MARCELDELALTTMKLLKELCSLEIRISEYAIIAQAVMRYYFMLIDTLKVKQEDTSKIFETCGTFTELPIH